MKQCVNLTKSKCGSKGKSTITGAHSLSFFQSQLSTRSPKDKSAKINYPYETKKLSVAHTGLSALLFLGHMPQLCKVGKSRSTRPFACFVVSFVAFDRQGSRRVSSWRVRYWAFFTFFPTPYLSNFNIRKQGEPKMCT